MPTNLLTFYWFCDAITAISTLVSILANNVDAVFWDLPQTKYYVEIPAVKYTLTTIVTMVESLLWILF